MNHKIKAKIYEVIQPAEDGKLASRIFDCFIMLLITIKTTSPTARTAGKN